MNTVPAWKKAYKVRVAVFVEYESDVEEERGRVQSLLENLRIEAEVLVFWLSSGNLPTYEIIVNGASPGKEHEEEVEECLRGQEWWDEIEKFRGKRGGPSVTEDLSDIASIFTTGSLWPESSFQQGPRGERGKQPQAYHFLVSAIPRIPMAEEFDILNYFELQITWPINANSKNCSRAFPRSPEAIAKIKEETYDEWIDQTWS